MGYYAKCGGRMEEDTQFHAKCGESTMPRSHDPSHTISKPRPESQHATHRMQPGMMPPQQSGMAKEKAPMISKGEMAPQKEPVGKIAEAFNPLGAVLVIGIAVFVIFSFMTGCGKSQKELNSELINACLYGDALEVEILLKKGADIEARCDIGGTPLYAAAQEGRTDIAKLLIDAGADVNARTDEGGTPLSVAAQEGHTETAKLLIDFDADLDSRDNAFGATPLNQAAVFAHTETTKLLIDAGADIEARTDIGLTPLFWVALEGHTDIAKLLIDAGADVNARDNDGAAPLHGVTAKGQTEMTKLLIDSGADVNARDNDGETPLSWALFVSAPDAINGLIEMGYSQEEINAIQKGAREVSELLKQHGGVQ